METHLLPRDHPAHRLVRELTGIGFAFSSSLSTLVDSLGENVSDEDLEQTAESVLAMTAGSIDPVLRKLPEEEVERTIALVGAVHARLLDDLRLAAEIAGRRESMVPTSGRSSGSGSSGPDPQP